MEKLKILQCFALTLCFFIMFGCGSRCPDDVNLGKLYLSSNTKSYLPAKMKVKEFIFEDNTGAQLIFTSQDKNDFSSNKIDVETLCEKGSYLDKVVQTAYYDTEGYHQYFYVNNGNYTLNVDAQLNNAADYGSRTDTVFYDYFAMSIYGTGPKSPNGVLSFMSDQRGNDAKIGESNKNAVNIFRYTQDTTIDNRTLKNIYYTPQGNYRNIFIYYSKERGIEALEIEDKLWWRKF